MTVEFELIGNLDRCPTCGRFVAIDESYGDLPPGGVQNVDYLASYCDEKCADAKSPPAIYEDTPEMEMWERKQRRAR